MNETEQLIISAHEAERERCARVALHLASNTEDPVVRALALMIADMIRGEDESPPRGASQNHASRDSRAPQ